jgi:hypothetical protein
MSEDNPKKTQKRRRHLDYDELPGRPFDIQANADVDEEDNKEEDNKEEGCKKEGLLATLVNDWIPLASQRVASAVKKLGVVKERLFPPKTCFDD